MNDLIKKLYLKLSENLILALKQKEIKNFENGEIDVLSTLLTIKKVDKQYKQLFDNSSLSKDTLSIDFSKESIDECIKNKLLRYGSLSNENKIFITNYGIYTYYIENQLPLKNLFISIDEYVFQDVNINIKPSEKLLCIFLVLMGADSENNKLDISRVDNSTLNKYFNFLKIIENKLNQNNISLGKEIGWGSGKNISFKGFIQNNDKLPKTGLYSYSKQGSYWLNLNSRKNVQLLLDLILSSNSENNRIIVNNIFYATLWELSNLMLTEIGIVPNELNKMLVFELKK